MLQRYTLRTRESCQDEGWDSFVNTHGQGHFLQSQGWGMLKASAGWHPLRVALWDTEREQIVAGAQVLRRCAAHIPLRLGHLAYIPRGPVLDWSQQADDTGSASPRLPELFFSQLLPFLRAQGASLGWNHVISPALISNTAIGYTRYTNRQATLNSYRQDFITPAGITNTLSAVDPLFWAAPSISIAGVLAPGDATPNLPHDESVSTTAERLLESWPPHAKNRGRCA